MRTVIFYCSIYFCLVMCFFNGLYAQTGPGGVGNSSNNILWLKADNITGVADSNSVAVWQDASGNGNLFSQSNNDKKPRWYAAHPDFNSRPVVNFDGSNDFLDYGNGSMSTASNYTFFFVYKTESNSRQYLLHTKSGTLKIPVYGGTTDKAYNDGTARGTEITGTNTRLVTWWLSNSGSSIYENGTQTQSGLTYTQRAINNSTSLGSNEKGNGQFFQGSIAEAIIFKTTLNAAERIIVENYLAAKYDLNIANNYYGYNADYGNNVSGIGRVNASNQHLAAESANILRVSNPSSLDNGEFLLFGHDNGSYAQWLTSDVPGSNLQRIARQWRFDETGDAGTVTISIDTALLPVKPQGYTRYVLWIDDDGNFSSGASQYVLSLQAGRYEVSGLNIPDGGYITLGIMQPEIRFSSTSASVSESSSSLSVNVTLNYALLTDVSVQFALTGGSATGGGVDFTRSDSSLTILAGATTAYFDINITDDLLEENDETIIITLRNPSVGTTLGSDSVFTCIINDNDALRKIQFATTTGSGSETDTLVTVCIKINLKDDNDTTSVNYTVSGGTAQNGGVDFLLANGTAKILPGDTMTSFTININNDIMDEDDEHIILTLSGSSANCNVGTNDSFIYTIIDDDPLPYIHFWNAASTVSEGESSPVLTVLLSTVSGKDIFVLYEVIGGTASGNGVDYTLNNDTLFIPAGNASGIISPLIQDDSDIETAETIVVRLLNPHNGQLGTDSIHTLTITDNDNLGATGPGGVGDAQSNILWLRADKITGVSNGSEISVWTDQSGNGANAVQNASANRPVYIQSDANFNNMPTVQFDGINDYFDLDALTPQAAADFSFFFVYRTTSTSSQYLFDTRSGRIIIPHEGGGDRAFNDGTARGTEITGTSTMLVHWELDDAGSSIYVNGAQTQSGLSYTQRAINNRTKLGSNQNNNGKWFNGAIAEAIILNKKLNGVQRILVENYLGAKYNLNIPNDLYAHESSHGYDVSGIGSQGIPVIHTAAVSAGILKVSGATSLESGDYLLLGHDNGSVANWSATESPNAEILRLGREWRFDLTGDPGTITLTLDTSLLPAHVSGYNGYVCLIDADGDFITGAKIFALEYDGGSTFSVSGITSNDGDYVTFGCARNVTKGISGNFNSPTSWLGGQVPGPTASAVIASNSAITLSANTTIGELIISEGGTVEVTSGTLVISNGSIKNFGNLQLGASVTIEYLKNGAQDIAPIPYSNLAISGSGIKYLTGNITVNGNLTISSGATLDAAGYAMNIQGNWLNAGGAFNHQNQTVTFSGSATQTISAGGSPFYNLTIVNTGSGILLNNDLTVTNVLTLTDGVITTGPENRVIVASSAPGAITGYSSASFINGNLRRYIATNTFTYAFPIGNGTAATNYFRADLVNNNLSGISYIDARFKPLTNHHDDSLSVADTWEHGFLQYTTINNAGVWELEPDAQPAAGSYAIKLYITNMSGLTDNSFAPLKRPTGSTSTSDWSTGGGTLSNNNGEGRLVEHGYAFRKNLTSFSDFGVGGGNQGGSGLPIKLLYFTAQPHGKTVELKWATATEVNNAFFTIERSENGRTFEEIVSLEGAGNSSVIREYKAYDEKPLSGVSYYRLKQTDFDGTASYSNIVSLMFNHSDASVVFIVPNPIRTDDPFSVILQDETNHGAGEITLTTMTGHSYVLAKTSASASEEISLQLPPGITPGFYILSYQNGNHIWKQKLLVK
ncbi:MAG: hypothetical protein KatS3mg031_0209 [Chitinophagales bacterium]|nr:MAG: hypothetical protein KatS3mg031_0209 [Chitinophagales bacterium]